MNSIYLFFFFWCTQTFAFPYLSSKRQRDESDCFHDNDFLVNSKRGDMSKTDDDDDEASFLQSHVLLESPPKASTEANGKVGKALVEAYDESQALPNNPVLDAGSSNVIPSPKQKPSLRGTLQAPSQAYEAFTITGNSDFDMPVVGNVGENAHSQHNDKVKSSTNATPAGYNVVAELAKVIVEQGKALEFVVIIVLCVLVLMPVALAVSALVFINFMPQQLDLQAKAKAFRLPGGLRGLRESLKPRVKVGGEVDGGNIALTPHQPTMVERLANDPGLRAVCSKHMAPVVRDQGINFRDSLLPHPLSAESDIIVGPTEVCFAGNVLPYKQHHVDLDVREADGAQVGIRIVIKEAGEECGVMIASDNLQVCTLYTGGAVVEEGQTPSKNRRVDLLRTGYSNPIATLSREDVFDGKLPSRVVARSSEDIRDAAEGTVLFEVLLDSHDRPMSVLLVDGRLIARVSVNAQGNIVVKAEAPNDLWLAVAGVVAAMKLANPPSRAA